MRPKWQHIARLLRTPRGRRRLLRGLLARMQPVIWPLASAYRRTLIRHVRIIAVVGSFGKTTTTSVVAAALGRSTKPSEGWNAGVFPALELLRVRPWSGHAVVEVGISRPGTMREYAKLVLPDAVIVTSIGSEHGSTLGSLESTREEKAAMVRALPPTGLAVLNGDDANVLWMRGETSAEAITFGHAPHNDVRTHNVGFDLIDAMRFTVHIGGADYGASTRLLGRHMAYPVLAAVALVGRLGMDVSVALRRIADLPPAPERIELSQTSSGYHLLIDTFKSHLETVEAALETFCALPAMRKLAVIGELEEPPGRQGDIYRDLGSRLAELASHVVFVGGKKTMSPLSSGAKAAGMSGSVLHFADRSPRRAVQMLRPLLRPGDLVLIKGRSTQKLVRIAMALEGHAVACDIPHCALQPGCRMCEQLSAPQRNKLSDQREF